MSTSFKRKAAVAAFGLVGLGIAAGACGDNPGDNLPSVTVPDVTTPTLPSVTTPTLPDVTVPTLPDVTLPTLPTTTTSTDGPTTTTSSSTTSTTSTSTTSSSTTTTAPPTTTTTSPPSTTTTTSTSTTTSPPSTTTTSASTTTSSTTASDELAAAPNDDDSGVPPWVWLVVVALLAAIGAVIYAIVHAKAKGARATWLTSARAAVRQAETIAANLDRAAGSLSQPTAGDRQPWLDSGSQLAALESSVAALIPDAPTASGESTETNAAAAALTALRSSITTCRSATTDAERTRFELVGPTDEQLTFAAESVRRSAAAIMSDAHTASAAFDQIDPPSTPGR